MLMLIASGRAVAGGGLLGIDHEWAYDNSGIWKRSYQLDIEYGVVVAEGVGALWLGNDDSLGHEARHTVCVPSAAFRFNRWCCWG
jgi:undecaprenyl-diphosphatase